MASEHRGVVKSGGLPIPGATVTATEGDRKVVTTTDERGAYGFPDLPDGVWNIEVSMFGFARTTREVGVAPVAPAAEWDLKVLPLGSALAGATAPRPVPNAAGTQPRTGPGQGAEGTRSAAAASGGGAMAGRGGRGAMAGNIPGGRGGAAGQQGQRGQGFQRLGVNATGDLSAGQTDGAINGDLSDLNQSAADALLVNGSVSRGLDAPPADDWFAGRGMAMMMGGRGMGGPEDQAAAANGIPGGPGTPGGSPGAAAGPGAGPGGGPGGRAMMGGPGGGFGGRGGFAGRGMGGPGGPGGRGGRGPMNRPGVAAFGNARRDRQMQYNGNVGFSLDNSAWDARSYSLTGQATPKPSLANARGTLMFGGPLKIPKLLSGRNSMFTFNYQMARRRTGSTSTTLLPSAEERAGDFSQSVVHGLTGPLVISDPLTVQHQPFPNNQIPASRISPIATGLLALYPLPNFAGNSKYNYQVPIVGINNQDNLNTRLNQTINRKNRLSGGFAYQRGNNNSTNLFGFTDTTSSNGINANVGWTHNFTTRLISNLNYRFSRSSSDLTPYFAYNQNIAGQLGIAGTDQSPQFWGPPNLTFSNGFQGLSDGNLSANHTQTSQVGESLIWIHGSHNMSFGGDLRRQATNAFSQRNPRGSFGFTGAASGYDLADFLLGYAYTATIAYGNADKYFRATGYDIFANDDWRISTRLSINAGLRYDYTAPLYELQNRLVGLDIGTGFGAIAPILPDQTGALTGNGYGRTLVNPDRNNIQPRIGLAWRPFAKHSTVVRAGYGLYYNTGVYSAIANQMAQQPPYSVTLNAQGLIPLATGLVVPTGLTTNTYAIDPNYRVGYAQNWTVSIQQNLPAAVILNVSYLGTKGTRLDQQYYPNSAPGGYTSTITGPNGWVYEQSNGNSHYEAAQFQLMRRFRSGFSGQAFYTFSKSIDDASVPGAGIVAQNWQDLSAERALSSFNHTHTLNLNMQYSTGVGRAGGTLVEGWKGALLKDWTVMTNITIQSGTPLTPIAGGVRATGTGTGASIGSIRADATGEPVNAPDAGAPFNLAAFANPAPGQWGNAGRNTIIGPSTFGLNASAGRVIRLGERRSADLRFDATNALNHVTFRGWVTTLGQQFGALSNPGQMRSMTATLRFRF